MSGSAPSAQQRASQLDVAVLGRLVQRGLPGLVARDVAATHGVDVEAELDEHLDRAGTAARAAAQTTSAGRSARTRPTRPAIVGAQPIDRRPIGGERGGRRRLRPGRARGARLPGRPRSSTTSGRPVGGGRDRRGAAAGERRDQVDAVVDEQPHPVDHAVGDRPRSWPRTSSVGVSSASPSRASPGTAVTGAEAELEEQLQVVVVGLEHAVVERLPVVRIGAGIEQEPCRAPASAGAGAGRPARARLRRTRR